ncbi:hypothetical protein K7432_017144, partial [Basidiobolus ranarum]
LHWVEEDNLHGVEVDSLPCVEEDNQSYVEGDNPRSVEEDNHCCAEEGNPSAQVGIQDWSAEDSPKDQYLDDIGFLNAVDTYLW